MSYNGTDINFRAIGRAVAFGVAGLLVINVGVWVLFRFIQTGDENVDVRRSRVAPEAGQPPPPLLQVDPRLEWKQLHQEQLDQLNSYGWISRNEGRVRIPIDRAMEMLIERQSEAK